MKTIAFVSTTASDYAVHVVVVVVASVDVPDVPSVVVPAEASVDVPVDPSVVVPADASVDVSVVVFSIIFNGFKTAVPNPVTADIYNSTAAYPAVKWAPSITKLLLTILIKSAVVPDIAAPAESTRE